MNDRIQRAFEEFHRQNHQVYAALVRMAFQYQKAGKKVGIKHLWEVLRWQQFTGQLQFDEYKLNNNFTSRYARLIMEREPELKGFFEIRRLWPEPLDRREA